MLTNMAVPFLQTTRGPGYFAQHNARVESEERFSRLDIFLKAIAESGHLPEPAQRLRLELPDPFPGQA